MTTLLRLTTLIDITVAVIALAALSTLVLA